MDSIMTTVSTHFQDISSFPSLQNGIALYESCLYYSLHGYVKFQENFATQKVDSQIILYSNPAKKMPKICKQIHSHEITYKAM